MNKPFSIVFAFIATVTSFFAAEKPNVLLILVDDLKPALGCYGDETAISPQIDKLAGRGMQFDLAYCNQAVCAPSRFTLMLGSHSTSTGLYGLGSPLRKVIPDAVTIPQYFAKHGGYKTESLGKIFHIGHGNEGDPASFSIPHFKEKVIEYVAASSKPEGKLTREEAMFENVRAPNFNALPRGAAFENPAVEDNAYADGRVAEETKKRLRAAKALREKDGTPFFIAAGFARPHLPFSAPKKYWDLYDPAKLPMPENEELPANSPDVAGKRGGEIRNYFPVPDKGSPDQISDELKRELIHGYYASVSYVDAQIGKVIDELDKLDLAKNTIVVLWGDHGFHLGDLGIWTKHTNYEQANRIPILITAPGVTPPNSTTKQLAESVDIFPTLAELAGLPAPAFPESLQKIDGVSLVPVLKDPATRVRDHAFHAYPKGKMGRAIRTERFRLVEWKKPGDAADTAEIELYDYQSDPSELKNHAAENPEAVNELRKILNSYPEAAGRSKNKKKAVNQVEPINPKIVNLPIHATAEVWSQNPTGVAIAQGGREHGYALHFVEGRPAFDVRVNGKVTRLIGDEKVSGKIKILGTLDAESISLVVNGIEIASKKSPGLIPVQPKDGLSVGYDLQSAAGNYDAPNTFSDVVAKGSVKAGDTLHKIKAAKKK